MHRLRQRLGIEFPLLQAPMAGVQGHRLAAAVSHAGGLGALPCAMLSADALRAEVQALRVHDKGPYNLNFFCHPPPPAQPARLQAWREYLRDDYRALDLDPGQIVTQSERRPFDADTAGVLETLQPPVISFHFGLPAPDLLARLRHWPCTIIASATTVDEACWLQQRGVDAIIAQGAEAGGHRGMFLTDEVSTQMGLFALLPQICAAVDVPVIAAGGIADADGVAAAIALGAAGVQVGTAYLLCPEADTSELHRQALASDAARQTAISNVFTGRPARGIVNHAMRAWGPLNPAVPDFPLAAAVSAPLRQAAEARGSSDYSAHWAGESAARCRPIPAAILTRELARGFPD
ncbi:2-nitropropane dioxygenase [Pseudoxanthomonas dokdonensis]|uniref:Nitronate monooxygenase n=2 Tax=Pseudoxanthomonas dokdonensis TaxID=344882 RepID=A0A0R0CFP7_9GAMM|nr:2-nitropropane dioxygenase [Pseudoxanthomonas dokdonensis]